MTALFFISIVWTTDIYFNFYETTMKTKVEIEVVEVELSSKPYHICVLINISNPYSYTFEIEDIVLDLALNNKYIIDEVISGRFQVNKTHKIRLERQILIPESRMFTIIEAQQKDKWVWTFSGSLHLTTYMGETRIRFKQNSTFIPKIG